MITEKQFITMLGLVIVPQVVELIARDSKLTEVQFALEDLFGA